jgi:hypothetical protein
LAANDASATMEASDTLRQTREYEHAAGPSEAYAYRESYPPEHSELKDDSADFDFVNHMEDFHSFCERFEESLSVGDHRTSDALLQVWGIRNHTHYQQVCRAAERFAGSRLSFEAWVECEIAVSVGTSEKLAAYGLSQATWALATAWWSRYFEENAMRSGGELHRTYSRLDAHYRSHYGI